MTTEYHRIDETTIAAVSSLGFDKDKKDWGAPRLTRIFNFTARQVVTLYERGGIQSYTIPPGSNYGNSSTGYSAAVTSAMQMQDFKDLPNPAEIAEMHERLGKMGGKPPPLEDVMPSTGIDKPRPGLKR
ncbi:MAG: hypothetical protein Q8K65_10545 [Alphaproteobacteria bacterium]|nr:hypothetical protein [Alphaproteobacteria bacterium]